MNTRIEDNVLIAIPDGNITATNSDAVGKELSEILKGRGELGFAIDASDITYVSSSGLRVLMMLSQELDDPMRVFNVGPDLYSIFDITGFTDILKVERKMKTLDIEGCEILGKGALGTVYKLDDENIVKVYNNPDCLPVIRRERKLSRLAFIKGIPTAISYEIVKVGESYGSVFELIDAKNMNELLVSHPDMIDEIVSKYITLLKKMHSVTVNSGELPSAKAYFLHYLVNLDGILPKELSDSLRDLLNEMPEDLHFIHGDIQMKNVMLQGDEPLVIDMETMCTGDPVFELQALFMCYRAYNEDEKDNSEYFLGFDDVFCAKLWDKILHGYYEGLSEDEISVMEDKIKLLGYLKFLDSIVTNGFTKPELREIRINHSVRNMCDLITKVHSLSTH